MTLTDLNRRLAALRGCTVEVAIPIVGDLVDALAALAADPQVSDEAVTNLITRALRAIRPRAERPPDRHTAIAALRQALAEGPRGPGRPTAPWSGPARTVRASDGIWAGVDAYARARGVSESRAAAELLAAGLAAADGGYDGAKR